MIAPIQEAAPAPPRRRTRGENVRQLVASLFLEEEKAESRPVSLVSWKKAWLLVSWAVAITGLYLAAMLGVF